jgi:hypothetical protein
VSGDKWLVGWLVSWLARSWLVGWLVSWLVANQQTSKLPPANQQTSKPEMLNDYRYVITAELYSQWRAEEERPK